MLYLDNAATTPLEKSVLDDMMPYLTTQFGNPSGAHKVSREIRVAVDKARRSVAEMLGAKNTEIYFTSSGTEADNWALRGVFEATDKKHLIITQVEHHANLYQAKALEKKGIKVTYLPVDEFGFINLEELDKSITGDTALVSVIFANNEVGTIQPLKKISEITKKHGVLLHTDAVQAVGHIPVNVNDLGVDLLSLSAHKFYGPKGSGALYIKTGTKIGNLFIGGAQERNRRAGTENVAGIIGLESALKFSLCTLEPDKKRISLLRDALIDKIKTEIPYTILNGAVGEDRLPGNVNFSFRFIEGESILLHLDMQGICASTGSACSSGALEPSHVLMAMGLGHEHANGAIRFSLGKDFTEEQIPVLMKVLVPTIEKLRNLSPLYDDFLKSEGVTNGI